MPKYRYCISELLYRDTYIYSRYSLMSYINTIKHEVPEGVTPCSGYTVIAGGVSTDRTRYSTSNIECEQYDKKATIKRPFEHCERCNIVYHRSCLEPQPAPSTAANPRVFLCRYNECRAEWDALMADPTLTLPNE